MTMKSDLNTNVGTKAKQHPLQRISTPNEVPYFPTLSFNLPSFSFSSCPFSLRGSFYAASNDRVVD